MQHDPGRIQYFRRFGEPDSSLRRSRVPGALHYVVDFQRGWGRIDGGLFRPNRGRRASEQHVHDVVRWQLQLLRRVRGCRTVRAPRLFRRLVRRAGLLAGASSGGIAGARRFLAVRGRISNHFRRFGPPRPIPSAPDPCVLQNRRPAESLCRPPPSRDRMAHKLVLLAGDGTGPEVMREAVKVLKAVQDAFGLSFDTIPYPAGGQDYLHLGAEWPDGAFESCKAADAILLGALGLPDISLPNGDLAGGGGVFGLRFGLDLYANVRPTKLYPNVKHKVHDGFKQVWEAGKVDFVIVRENTEGLYTPAR